MNSLSMMDIQPLTGAGTFCALGCPYFNGRQKICTAARQLLTPGEHYRASYCRSDDYDNCPFYLCQALRNSQALGHGRESLSSGGK